MQLLLVRAHTIAADTMTYLTAHLPFPSASSSRVPSASSSSSSSSALPPPRSQLVISDTLQSPAHFALYHLVSAALGKEKRKVVWVDFRGEGRPSWEAVLKKLGTPLPPTTSSSFVYLSPSSLPSTIPSNSSSNTPSLFTPHGPSLRPTYDAILSHLPPARELESDTDMTPGPLVILDGLTELLWMGFSPVEIGRFVRAVFAQVRQTNSSLVSTIHGDTIPLSSSPASASSQTMPPETELLVRLLRLGQGVWWRISHLPSGRSGDVMGEISSHPLTATTSADSSSFPAIPRSQPLQYRLESSTVRVFPKGTGRGFL